MHPVYRFLNDNQALRGPHATLWHAHDELLGLDVAIKELRNWAARPARARAAYQFAHVRRLSLSQPGLAPVHGADADRGWLVLDYFHEGSLAGRLAGPSPPEFVHRVLGDVLRALAFLHEKGLLHGAVKPTNLFFPAGGQVLLADGLGLRLDGQGRAPDCRDLFGGLEAEEAKYLAPECLGANGGRVGRPADLYALGLTALELLLGTGAFLLLFPKVRCAAQRWEDWHRSD